MTKINGEYEEFEVIIREEGGNFWFKMDCLDEPVEEPAKCFTSDEEIILHAALPGDVIYFHLLQTKKSFS